MAIGGRPVTRPIVSRWAGRCRSTTKAWSSTAVIVSGRRGASRRRSRPSMTPDTGVEAPCRVGCPPVGAPVGGADGAAGASGAAKVGGGPLRSTRGQVGRRWLWPGLAYGRARWHEVG